jgi:hypothetical protein
MNLTIPIRFQSHEVISIIKKHKMPILQLQLRKTTLYHVGQGLRPSEGVTTPYNSQGPNQSFRCDISDNILSIHG